MSSTLPLSGIVVADFSRILAGPLCSQMLAELGARVIKVEEPAGGDETRRWGPPFIAGESAYFLSINRGKESVALDLKSDAGREAARRLIARADVVLHNFRDDQASRLGLDEAAVREISRRAVLCAIRGFERGTAEEGQPGFDLLAQAAGGLMAITGEPEGAPMKVGVALSDVLTAHYAFGAICAALYEREKGASGRSIEISLVGATIASLVNVAQGFLVSGEEPRRYGNAHPSIVPYQAFSGSDRDFVVAAASDRDFQRLCGDVLDRPELAADPRFATNRDRVSSRRELIPLLAAILRTRPAAEWVERCRAAGVPATVVASVSEALEATREALLASVLHPVAGDLTLVSNPVRLDGASLPAGSAPPRLGEHTEAVLHELE